MHSTLNYHQLLRAGCLFGCWLLLFPLVAQNDALLFNGLRNHYALPDDDRLDAHEGITIEVDVAPNCMNPPAFGRIADDDLELIATNGSGTIVSKGTCNDAGYALSMGLTNIEWVYHQSPNCNFSGTRTIVRTTDFRGAYNRRYVVTVTQAEGQVKIFVDGREMATDRSTIGSDPAGSNVRNSGGAWILGASRLISFADNELANHYTGLLYGVRQWNSVLSPEEVRDAARGNEPRPANLVLEYNVEDNVTSGGLTLRSRTGGNFTTSPALSSYPFPQLVNTADYRSFSYSLGPDREFCKGRGEPLAIPERDDYRTIQWSIDNDTARVTARGTAIYWVLTETERCRYQWDSVFLERVDVREREDIVRICPFGESYVVDGIAYGVGDTVQRLFRNADDCDTLLTTFVRPKRVRTERLEFPVCNRDTLFANGIDPRFVSGTFVVPGDSIELRDTVNCDTILRLVIPYVPLPAPGRDTVYVCSPGERVEYRGQLLSAGENQLVDTRNAEGCDERFTVDVLPPPPGDFLGPDVAVCSGVFALTGIDPDVRWANGTTGGRTFDRSGTYVATRESPGGCRVTDTLNVALGGESIYLPSAFSPNADGVNDCYGIGTAELPDAPNYRLSIYDRWGGSVFDSVIPGECWDGTVRGEAAAPGIYVVVVNYLPSGPGCGNVRTLRGQLALLR